MRKSLPRGSLSTAYRDSDRWVNEWMRGGYFTLLTRFLHSAMLGIASVEMTESEIAAGGNDDPQINLEAKHEDNPVNK